ncbi:MAG: hypothetical protein RBT80_25730, partial [Candidatus Vecturithrix sp.]|nr:hypothetical protein [Candidatus Vecturithrix sp.]
DLANIENCASDPSLRTVIKIAGAFGVDILYLMSGVDCQQTRSIASTSSGQDMNKVDNLLF